MTSNAATHPDTLALLGGDPLIQTPPLCYRSMGEAEKLAVARVMDSDCISGFFGSPGNLFLGGPTVRAFEDAWCKRFCNRHAVSVNSATSGLIAAVGAAGVGPGDEIIVPPYTMSATVVAPLFYGAIPVFVDIEEDTFCLDPDLVQKAITSKTKVIIAVNLFGHPAQLGALRKIADEADLILIEDSSQSPLGSENDSKCGTVGDMGVFSFNYHKHIHTGEGGIVTTDNPKLAKRLQLIRNHGENVVERWNIDDITNLVGLNFRMTELSAAIGIEQLKNADHHVKRREEIAHCLSDAVRGLKGLTPPMVRSGCRHNYYCWVMRCDEDQLGVSRSTFSKALTAEGFPHGVGYVRPLYLLPLFQQGKAIGRDGWPFNQGDYKYDQISCPVTERMYEKEVILFEPCVFDLDAKGAELMGAAIVKVHRNLAALSDWETRQADD
jgi:perosamine synthetase